MFNSFFSKKPHKNILTQIVIALFIFFGHLFSPTTAIGDTNTFFCDWDGIQCYQPVTAPYYTCNAGFQPTPGYCNQFSNASDCQNTGNSPQACEEIYPNTYYKCVLASNTCQPCSAGEYGCTYSDSQACENACKGTPNYLCTTANTCEKSTTCDPEKNPKCYTSIKSCKSSGCKVEGSNVNNKTLDNTVNPTEGCDGENQINTALGCIPTKIKPFTNTILKLIIGIAGGASLILMLVGAIMFMTGGSNPEQVKRGKEIFTGAVTGLVFIILSTVILSTIAGDIIGLEGFTKK